LSALASLGLNEQDFRFVSSHDGVLAGAAFWDQRIFKQTVIRGYSAGLALARPMVNFISGILNTPRLPEIGAELSNAFISHLAVNPEEPALLTSLISELLGMAEQRGIELITLGFASNDSRLRTVSNSFRTRQYRSRLYLVQWPEIGGGARELDSRVLAPEIALL